MAQKPEKTIERECCLCRRLIRVRPRVLRYGEQRGKPWGQTCAKCAQAVRTLGPKNPNYIHGKGMTYRKERIRKERREAVRRRDGWRCQCCLRPGVERDATEGVKLDVHHVIRVEQGGSDADWNLCSLCRSCHNQIDRGRLPAGVSQFIWPPPGADWAIGTPISKQPFVLKADSP